MTDPVVKRIVDKMYGDDDDLEFVAVRGDQVIVSRETLTIMWGLLWKSKAVSGLTAEQFAEIKEILR